MPAIKDPRREKFCQNLAKGMIRVDAYVDAGYSRDKRNALRAAAGKQVVARVKELQNIKAARELASDNKAIAKLSMSKEVIGREFARIGTSNIEDFVRISENGKLVELDFSKATRDQLAAVQEITIEYHDDEKLRVKKARLRLYQKTPALVGLARLFGWISDAAKQDPLVERLRLMTPAQRVEHALALRARIDAALSRAPAQLEQQPVTDAEFQEMPALPGAGDAGEGGIGERRKSRQRQFSE